jgi:hypothetical protein
MRHARRIGVAAALIALAAAVSSGARAAVLDRVGIYVDAWQQSLTGYGRIDGATAGDTFSLTQDVGLDGEEVVGELGAWFHPVGPHRLRFAGFSASLEGSSSLARPLRIGDLDVPEGTDVGSALDLKFFKAHYSYSIVNKDLVNVAVLAGLDYLDGKGEIAALDTVQSSSIKGGVPVIGASVQVQPLGFLRIYGEASGTSLTVNGVHTDVRDMLARVEVYVLHAFGIGAGYRKFSLEADEEGEGKIDVSTDGYQVYLLLRF